MARQTGGYRIWANSDRCVADWDLRAARRSTAKVVASHGPADDLFHCLKVEAWAMEAVQAFEARYGLGVYAK